MHDPQHIMLIATPHNRTGEIALQIYAAALESVRADSLINTSLHLDGDTLEVRGDRYDLASYLRILVLGAGKASAGMAAALEQILGDRISEGVVVTKHGHAISAGRIRVLEASHPLPGEDSVEAGRQILALAESANEGDLVICLLSGGASALMELPALGVTLDDLRITTDLLQRAGADIAELNGIRRHLSRIKAGGLARAAAPAKLICLVISDVLGNDLSIIGSGPCLINQVQQESPLTAIGRFNLSSHLPAGVMRVLAEERIAPPNTSENPHYILGDIRTAVEACRREAVSLGLNPLVIPESLNGEASAVARGIPNLLPESGTHDSLIAGGETTVTVNGTGKGGRAQEFAAAASEVLPEGASLLCAGTDGTDGPTDAAGGLVDSRTFERTRSRGIDPESALANNDAYRLLEAADSLVFTGPTQSNVNDILIYVNVLLD